MSLHIIEPAASDVRDLLQAEHLLLFGFRALALGAGDCPRLRATYAGLLDGAADDALGHMLALVRTVGLEGRRRIRVHALGCCSLIFDERLLLAALSAAQTLFHSDEAALRGGLDALLGGAPSEACVLAAQSVAAAVVLAGYELPARLGAAAPEPSPTLH